MERTISIEARYRSPVQSDSIRVPCRGGRCHVLRQGCFSMGPAARTHRYGLPWPTVRRKLGHRSAENAHPSPAAAMPGWRVPKRSLLRAFFFQAAATYERMQSCTPQDRRDWPFFCSVFPQWSRHLGSIGARTKKETPMKLIKELCNDEQGAAMAEYALLLALIAVAAIGVLQVLGGQITAVFERAGDAIDEALPASSSS